METVDASPRGNLNFLSKNEATGNSSTASKKAKSNGDKINFPIIQIYTREIMLTNTMASLV